VLFRAGRCITGGQCPASSGRGPGRYGTVDILCNNAATLLSDKEARAHELSREAWDRTLAVNLTGYWLCSKYVIPVMLEKRSGSIIHVASPTGLLGFPKLTGYSTSKEGVFALMRAMAADYGPDGIRVNAIVPGTIDTPMNATTLSAAENRAHFALATAQGGVKSPRQMRLPAHSASPSAWRQSVEEHLNASAQS
jgi:NAD(P)-dependent dehydrogenase (short-subunit alcohol dehydrogenase family)